MRERPGAPARTPARSAPLVSLQNILPDALESLLRQSPLSDGKVAFAWRAAVGPGVARASRVRLADNNRLEVITIDARWQREIRRSLAIIRPRLDALLGRDVINGIDIRTGDCPSKQPNVSTTPSRPDSDSGEGIGAESGPNDCRSKPHDLATTPSRADSDSGEGIGARGWGPAHKLK